MTPEQFSETLERRFDISRSVLATKADEYASDKSRFHNFYRAGQIQGCTPERALMGMMTKHTVSVMDIIDNIEKGEHPNIELWDEKIGDYINYLLLLDGMVRELING